MIYFIELLITLIFMSIIAELGLGKTVLIYMIINVIPVLVAQNFNAIGGALATGAIIGFFAYFVAEIFLALFDILGYFLTFVIIVIVISSAYSMIF